jgi:TetR/AcrR family transcriptional repressor for divergent bdcA
LTATVGGNGLPVRAHQAVTARRSQDRQRIHGCVERAMERGELISATDSSALTAVIQGFLIGISTQLRDGVPAKELDAAADALLMTWDAFAPTNRPFA